MPRLAGGVRQTSFALSVQSSQGGGPKLARLENPAAFAVAALKTVAEEAKEKEAVATAVTEPPSPPPSQGCVNIRAWCSA